MAPYDEEDIEDLLIAIGSPDLFRGGDEQQAG